MSDIKIQNIYVGQDEDIAALAERMVKSWAVNIVIIFPKDHAILRSLISLKLLKHQADDLGKNSLLVTSDEQGQVLGSQAGFEVVDVIPDFSDVLGVGQEVMLEPRQLKISDVSRPKMIDHNHINDEEIVHVVNSKRTTHDIELQREEKIDEIAKYWEEDPPSKKGFNLESSPGNGVFIKIKSFLHALSVNFARKLFWSLLGVGLAILLLVIFFVLPKADVELIPKSEPLAFTMAVLADKNIADVDAKLKKIPLQALTVEKQLSKEFEITEVKNVKEKAKGVVTIFNEYSESSQVLVATTRLQSQDGKIFRLVSNTIVPGAKIINGVITPSSIDVNVIADQYGSAYNIAPSDFTIPGFAGTSKFDKFYGKSKTAMVGGAEGTGKILTLSGVEKAKLELAGQVAEDALKELKAQTPINLKLIDGSLKAEIIETKTSVPVGSMADKYVITLKAVGKGLAIDEQFLKQLAEEVVSQQLSAGKSIAAKNQKIEYSISKVDLEKSQLILDVKVNQSVAFKIDAEQIKKTIAGKSEIETKAVFQSMAEVKEVKLSFWPFWVKAVPKNIDKIYIKIED